MDKKVIKAIREDISKSTIPEQLKVLYLMANATEILSQQSFQRIRAVFAQHGLVTKENDLLTGINQYCRLIKMASFQFFDRIDPQIINATWGMGRDEDNPDAPPRRQCLRLGWIQRGRQRDLPPGSALHRPHCQK